MIDDEMRREVAARLRNDVSESECIDYAVFRIINDVLGIEHATGAHAAHVLADLIDRTTCFDTESKDSKSFTCSACGFSESKLVVSPFALSFLGVKPSYRYCPNCGADVLDR